ncbi:MAG: DUF4340 domain-containing protein [Schleiferiaceae bacterium]|nr:DUF4340 domain-containing protein [Schleiferiaceae bacterium]
MKNKSSLGLLIVIVLAILGIWWFTTRDSSGMVERLQDEYAFTVKDTASIDKIIIRDKTPAEVTVIKTLSGWQLNGEVPVRWDVIDVLLETLYRQELRNFVPERTQPNVMKAMSVSGVEVEIYQNGKRTKHFVVGNETMDQNASYMMMKGASQPYAVYIPGFNGYLSTRYFAQEHLWRDRKIWGYDNLDIAKVAITYPQQPSQSFEVLVDKETFTVYDGKGQTVQGFDPQAIQQMLGAFKAVNYEAEIIPTDGAYAKQDSIKTFQTPAFEIFAQRKNGESKRLIAYYIPAAEDTFDENDEPAVWDPDRLYAFIEGERFVLVQYYGLGSVLWQLSDLLQPKSVVPNS